MIAATQPKLRSLLIEASVSAAVLVVAVGLGAPLGLLWQAWAPKVELVQTAYGPYPLEPEPEGYVADEGWFVFIAIGAGIVLALLAWFVLRRFRGPGVLVALALGSIVGSVFAAWLGHRVGLPAYQRTVAQAQVGQHFFRHPNLRLTNVGLWLGLFPRVRGIALLQALVATAVYTACAGFSYSPSLKPSDESVPVEDVSLDLPEWQVPTTAPAPHAPAEVSRSPDAGSRARPEDG